LLLLVLLLVVLRWLLLLLLRLLVLLPGVRPLATTSFASSFAPFASPGVVVATAIVLERDRPERFRVLIPFVLHRRTAIATGAGLCRVA
jgi:hypothetical protein